MLPCIANNNINSSLTTEAEHDDLVDCARSLARLAHASQTDKAGLPYIDHVARVAEGVAANGHCRETVAAAWLHDVLEDQPEHADSVLLFPAAIVEAVDLLTRKKHVSIDSYYAGIRRNRIALAVKAADIADNSSAERLALLSSEDRDRLLVKYSKAKMALGLA
ncbi:HD domain-containing protein [Xanthomonas perforans]|uniref:HD domain-containing protein n=1 Tax=Xanthomonas perforans TaxID=442694 RepID=UPI001E3B10BF|nr:HD domain-containing protein [Xanthomonas perforans]MCF5986356.1 HD domain-containing protein [Xanthomonas perforans]MCF6078453.1 HD domain-containing protein [Xanthomonas perforans]MDS6451700.1 HD domain-containing protein [Xanthomonas perforans]MDS6477476.1 HD domain-containing protein [Xanthomonas perforans]MDS6489593.1 HD domain-containing protein [Xanthomonas perforans]